uniref:Uncharacterized protein n=1 Tax=Anguilla anguilla TaxID=7936 RepID=A0A0E9V0E0_ANGAN
MKQGSSLYSNCTSTEKRETPALGLIIPN